MGHVTFYKLTYIAKCHMTSTFFSNIIVSLIFLYAYNNHLQSKPPIHYPRNLEKLKIENERRAVLGGLTINIHKTWLESIIHVESKQAHIFVQVWLFNFMRGLRSVF